MDDDNVMSITQYKVPPLWWEFAAYLGMLLMFALMLVDSTNIWAGAVITGWAMYWNYHLFRIIREYVRYVNANEISKLLTALAEADINKHKDGTFQDSECLTKEQGDEQESSKGD